MRIPTQPVLSEGDRRRPPPPPRRRLPRTDARAQPRLWFDGQAESAAAFYVGLFPDGRIVQVHRMGPGEDAPAITVDFEITGRRFLALNGGRPQHRFTPAASFVLSCDDQSEMWAVLGSNGGEPGRCGSETDRFGVS